MTRDPSKADPSGEPLQVGLSPLQSGGRFEETIEECVLAESLGFDSVWLGEHHNHMLLYPTPLLGLAAIASRTRRVRLGTAVVLLPLHHPVAIAEQGAMVDLISGGRLTLGIGAGYAPEEFAAFGLSTRERGSRLEEGAALLRRLWTEEDVTHAGRHYRVAGATIGPRPVQRPRPPIWFAGWAEPAVRRAARLGDAWLGGPSARLDEAAACVRTFRAARGEAHADPAGVALIRYVFVADSREAALAAIGDAAIRVFESTYFRWPHPIVRRPPGVLTAERLAEERIVLGTPGECIEQIERCRSELGLEHLVCRFSLPGVPRDASLQALERFAREVLPALRG